MKVIVIGGGASGMAAALEASRRHSVTVLERGPRLGRKLAVTGNGRCNLTNLRTDPTRYHGGGPDFVRPALERFGVEDTLGFFRQLGLVTVSEPSGRVYPFSDQAGSVVDVLRLALAGRGVLVRTDTEVKGVRVSGDGFTVLTDSGEMGCDRLILAAGGAASPRAGGSELGFKLLTSLGHRVTELRPSLVQIRTENGFTRPLKGVRADALVEVLDRSGGVLASSAGEVQFTDYGVSGPAVFEVSRAVSVSGGAAVRLDLMRSLDRRELTELILSRAAAGLTVNDLLTGTVHNKLGRTVLTSLGYRLSDLASGISYADAAKIAAGIKRVTLRVTGTMGMDGAQATAGGADTSQFDPETMESLIVPGLYACGEVLDVDGDCGGYNLQWAWSSGRLAGRLGETR